MLSSLSWCQCYKPSLLFHSGTAKKQASVFIAGKVCHPVQIFSCNVLKERDASCLGNKCHNSQNKNHILVCFLRHQ
jgi:hypothetical protein